MIWVFLSGKIIHIPFGTNKGGIIAAVGVLVIMLISFLISFGALLISSRMKKKIAG
jgi:hypothetical protein